MSMHHYGASGYVVNAKELISLLPDSVKDEFLVGIHNEDEELVSDILDANLPKWLPSYGLFHINDEDEPNNLEVGEMYVSFSTDDLYVRQPRPELIALNEAGISPVWEQWAKFG
jgi:hypothetical protein